GLVALGDEVLIGESAMQVDVVAVGEAADLGILGGGRLRQGEQGQGPDDRCGTQHSSSPSGPIGAARIQPPAALSPALKAPATTPISVGLLPHAHASAT